MSEKKTALHFSADAAVVLALAETAVPFAASTEDEAERWVRVLRLHGQVGATLQALGVGEAPLETPAESADVRAARPPAEDVIGAVARRAARLAIARRSATVATVDVLFAVFDVYGTAFDRALYIRGTTRDELIERLRAGVAAAQRRD